MKGNKPHHSLFFQVHERHLNTDFLLALLRAVLLQRSDLRVVLMSATISFQTYSAYFGGAPVIQVCNACSIDTLDGQSALYLTLNILIPASHVTTILPRPPGTWSTLSNPTGVYFSRGKREQARRASRVINWKEQMPGFGSGGGCPS